MSTPTSDPANPTSNTPLSPLSHPARTSTFPHQTSPGVTSQTRLIDTNTRAINDAPVELDGSAVGDTVGGDVERRKGSVLSPADEEDIDAEFLGEGGQGGRGVKVGEERAAMLASRSKNPGVIVDVPRYPTAEEVQAAKSADGMVTPGL